MLTSSSKLQIESLRRRRFWATDRHRKCTLRMPGFSSLPDFSTSRFYTSEKILNNINEVVWRQGKQENCSLPVTIRGSKTWFALATHVESSCCWFEEDAARNYSKVRAARAARKFVTIPPIKFLICDVFIPVAVVYAKAPRFNMYRDTLLTLCWSYQSLCLNWKISFKVKTCLNYASAQWWRQDWP